MKYDWCFCFEFCYFCFFCFKKGVGKSSIACNLAIALTKLGKKVGKNEWIRVINIHIFFEITFAKCEKGILDVDVCGPSVPRIMRVSDEKITNAGYGWIPAK